MIKAYPAKSGAFVKQNRQPCAAAMKENCLHYWIASPPARNDGSSCKPRQHSSTDQRAQCACIPKRIGLCTSRLAVKSEGVSGRALNRCWGVFPLKKVTLKKLKFD